jgi:hypothetical protein
VASPTFSPAPGPYASPQTITLSSATPDAQIFYTTNGNAPRFDVPNGFTKTYTGPISVANSSTIRAVARKTDFSNSVISVGNYVIGPVRMGFDEEVSSYYFAFEEGEGSALQVSIKLIPNPSQGRFNLRVENSNESAEIEILNMLGQTIWSGKLEQSQHQTEIDITRQPAGIYSVRYKSSKTNKEIRIVKE